jgi:hypothetical protein
MPPTCDKNFVVTCIAVFSCAASSTAFRENQNSTSPSTVSFALLLVPSLAGSPGSRYPHLHLNQLLAEGQNLSGTNNLLNSTFKATLLKSSKIKSKPVPIF